MKFKSPWHKNQTKTRFISEGKISINRNVQLIQVCIALCPLFGLMGTVTGMIEVFQVMAFTGGGDARSMAGGVSKATLPTMAGMVSSLSGVLAMIWVKNQVESNELMMVDYVTIKQTRSKIMRRNAISAAAREEESEINLTPMLDVVFIMLIFFIVTANFIKRTWPRK